MMREIALDVAAADAEALIDRVITMAPYGILDEWTGDRVVLRVRAPDGELPASHEFVRHAGGIELFVSEREVPDGWAERRLLDYVPQVVAGICVRPDWAPATDGTIDVALRETAEFGSGLHPTTRDSIMLLRAIEGEAPFADLGCGTGVLSIVAAKLGLGPLTAVDVREPAIACTIANAELNGVELARAYASDLLTEPAPCAPVMCANMPAIVHEAVGSTLVEGPLVLIASGVRTAEFDAVCATYARLGLEPRKRLDSGDWVTCAFGR